MNWFAQVQAIYAFDNIERKAQEEIKNHNYESAVVQYTECIQNTQFFHFIPPEKRSIIYFQRSEAYFKLRKYIKCANDARSSTVLCNNFTEAHFMEGLANKEMSDFLTAATCFISAVNTGLSNMFGADVMAPYYVELIRTLCILDEIPDELEELITVPQNKDVMSQILHKLSQDNQWGCVAYLYGTGDILGADSKIAGSFSNFCCPDIPVAKLFKETSGQKHRWKFKLAIKLFKNGASFQDFEKTLDLPILHFGIAESKKTEDVSFLKFILSLESTDQFKKDAVNEAGDTALQDVLKDVNFRETTTGEAVIRILKNHGCCPTIRDLSDIKPKALNGENTDLNIRNQIEKLQKEGRTAFQRDDLSSALDIYTNGINLCSKDQSFSTKYAVFLSNRSNIHGRGGNHEQALKDAEMAVEANPYYSKAYFRKGKELLFMNKNQDAFTTFLEGFLKSESDTDTRKQKLELLVAAVDAFEKIDDTEKNDTYDELFREDFKEYWADVLERLSNDGKWMSIRHLVMGLEVEDSNVHQGTGVAWSAKPKQMSFKTVFQFIKEHNNDVTKWLTPTLTVLVSETNDNLKENNDSCIHFAVRYAILTEDTELLFTMSTGVKTWLNKDGDSPYHIVVKSKLKSDGQQLEKIIRALISKNIPVKITDKVNKLPSDYIDSRQHPIVYEMLQEYEQRSEDIRKHVFITQEMWMRVIYNFYIEKKTKMVEYLYFSRYVDDKSIPDMRDIDIQPLCKIELMDKCPNLLDFITKLIAFGSDYKRLSTVVGDTYIHATVRLAIPTWPHILDVVLQKAKHEDKEDLNLRDKSGNTALHVVCKDKWTRHSKYYLPLRVLDKGKFIEKLVKFGGINPKLRNNEGKTAISLLPKNDKTSKDVLRQLMQRIPHQENPAVICTKRAAEQPTETKRPTTNIAMTKESGTRPTSSVDEKEDEKCKKCSEVYQRCKQIIVTESRGALVDLVKIFKSKHRSDLHKEIVSNSISLISDHFGKMNTLDIPAELCKIANKDFKRFIDDMAKQKKWFHVFTLISSHSKVHGENRFTEYADKIPFIDVITHMSGKILNGNDISYKKRMVEIIGYLIENRTPTCFENDEQECIKLLVDRELFDVLSDLICNFNFDPKYLTLPMMDTPIHAAVLIALHHDPGNTSILKHCFELFKTDQSKYGYLNPKQKDKSGNTLYHLVAKAPFSEAAKQIADLLYQYHIPCKIVDNNGKYPNHYLQMGDKRMKIFQKAMEYERQNALYAAKKINSDSTKKSKPVMNKPLKKTSTITVDRKQQKQHLIDKQKSIQTVNSEENSLEMSEQDLLKKITELIQDIERKPRNQVKETFKGGSNSSQVEVGHLSGATSISENIPRSVQDEEITLDLFLRELEHCEWEIEITQEVVKKLQSHHVMPYIKQNIFKVIRKLASGEYTNTLCKKLHTSSDTIELFESKLDKGCRLIWEVAVEFSPRLSNLKSGLHLKLYSDVIRVWRVVLAHKDIHNEVTNIINQIERSHELSSICLVKKTLQLYSRQDNTEFRSPRIFIEDGAKSAIDTIDDKILMCPPGSTKEKEFSTVKFYSFTKDFANNIWNGLQGEFPFRETDIEYEIVHLPFTAPIVLIGRSGTGKTTCCLYRLWYKFVEDRFIYETDLDDMCEVPFDLNKDGTVDYVAKGVQNVTRCNVHSHETDRTLKLEELNNGITFEESTDKTYSNESNSTQSRSSGDDGETEDESACYNDSKASEKACLPVDISNNESQYELKKNEVPLRKMFITKNSVLCEEVKKHFVNFMTANAKITHLVEWQNKELPHRIQDLHPNQYPLFITAKHFLIILDASLGPPYFIDRHKVDGSPKVDLDGWTGDEDLLDSLFLFENIDDEEDGSDESEDEDKSPDTDERKFQITESARRHKSMKVDHRKEVTYSLFVTDIWPKLVGKFKTLKRMQPLLVWTEIMSIIKGSYEAIESKEGILSEAEYLMVGRKKAPIFNECRPLLYKVFKKYESFKQNNGYFDQIDFVRHIIHRLPVQENHREDFILDEIYVDEAQDFTQAELYLLIKICKHPYSMFITGDTAQCIMKGISFRFKDLVSLFHKASKETVIQSGFSAKPKQIYHLPHNYRSHSGVTTLAASVLEILSRYFPDSFDDLEADQSFFKGPKPVLLNTGDKQQLPLLLSDRGRESSDIEFGAHQAILVTDDKAREGLPTQLKSALVLTLYEAKGLEFDDVLLYNMFTNSQAKLDDWRVITSFLMNEKSDQILSSGYKIHSRPNEFDKKQHNILNPELKQLYTAITRARVNVWIFDSDEDVRRPMFEYFKALDLVNEYVEGTSVFACVSESQDWNDRGENFMKRKMYDKAVQCFYNSGDEQRRWIAEAYMAYDSAKQGSQDRRKGFLSAAQQFLMGKHSTDAAKCLVRANEVDLAVQIYDKKLQFERIGNLYNQMKRPIESHQFYMKAGRFDKAIDVLLESKRFTEAIKCIQDYQNLSEETKRPVPKQHKLRENQTLDQISSDAAKYYHKQGDKKMMSQFLNCMEDITLRVDFLMDRFNENNDYIHIAADLYRKEGKTIKAANLYMNYGHADNALTVLKTERSPYDFWYCSFLSIQLRIEENKDGSIRFKTHGDHKNPQKQLESIIQGLKRSEQVSDRKSKQSHLLGEAFLLLGRIANNQNDIQKAFNSFVKQSPVNYTGKIECLNWMVHQSDFTNSLNISKVVKGVEDLFQLLKIMTQTSKEDKIKQNQIIREFGVSIEAEACKCNPFKKPRIMRLLGEKVVMSVSTPIGNVQDIKDLILVDLLEKGKTIFQMATSKLMTKHEETPSDQTKSYINIYLHYLLQMETMYQEALKDLGGILQDKSKEILESFVEAKHKFMFCKGYFSDFIDNITRRVLPIDFNRKIVDLRNPLKIFLVDKLHNSRTNFTVFEPVFLFVSVHTFRRYYDVGMDFEKEFSAIKTAFNNFCQHRLHGKFESMVKEFIQSISLLTIQKDPFGALKHFCTFITEVKRQDPITVYDSSVIMFWMEYFMVLSFALQSKYFCECCGNDNPSFTLPASWFKGTIQTANKIFHKSKGSDLNKIVASCKLKRNQTSKDIEKLSIRILEAVVGFRGRLSFIDIVVNKCQRTQREAQSDSIAELEIRQALTFCLICILNMGKWLPVDYETIVLRKISSLKQQNKLSDNIRMVLDDICKANGISEIYSVLGNMCKESDLRVVQCMWDNEKKQLKISDKFKCILMDKFHLLTTKPVLINPNAQETIPDVQENIDEIDEPGQKINEKIPDFITDEPRGNIAKNEYTHDFISKQKYLEKRKNEDSQDFISNQTKVDNTKKEDIRDLIFDETKLVERKTEDIQVKETKSVGIQDFTSNHPKTENTNIKNNIKSLEQRHEEIIIPELLGDFYFSELIINEKRCDICNELFDMSTVDDGDDTLTSPYLLESPNTQVTTNPFERSFQNLSLDSIARSLSSSSAEVREAIATDRNDSSSDGAGENSPLCNGYSLQRSNSILSTTSNPEKENANDIKERKRIMDDHMKSTIHRSRLRSFKDFQKFYLKRIRPAITLAQKFIEKHGLSSPAEMQKFKGDDIRINKFLKTFKGLKQNLTTVIQEEKKWENTEMLCDMVNTVEKQQRDIHRSVKNSQTESGRDDKDNDELVYTGVHRAKKKLRKKKKRSS